MTSIRDPEHAPPRESPFPPGTSPFRQKGNAYLGDVKYYDAVVRGGFEAVVATLDPPHRAFFRQTFRPSEWYDAYPGAQIELAAARLRGFTFEKHRLATGAWHADHASRGLYGALLRVVSNDNVALWGPRISSLYFEFGKTDSKILGEREVLVTRRGVPRDLAQWIVFASLGFVEATLRHGGARAPQMAVTDVSPDGVWSGRPLCRIDLRLTWS